MHYDLHSLPSDPSLQGTHLVLHASPVRNPLDPHLIVILDLHHELSSLSINIICGPMRFYAVCPMRGCLTVNSTHPSLRTDH